MEMEKLPERVRGMGLVSRPDLEAGLKMFHFGPSLTAEESKSADKLISETVDQSLADIAELWDNIARWEAEEQSRLDDDNGDDDDDSNVAAADLRILHKVEHYLAVFFDNWRISMEHEEETPDLTEKDRLTKINPTAEPAPKKEKSTFAPLDLEDVKEKVTADNVTKDILTKPESPNSEETSFTKVDGPSQDINKTESHVSTNRLGKKIFKKMRSCFECLFQLKPEEKSPQAEEEDFEEADGSENRDPTSISTCPQEKSPTDLCEAAEHHEETSAVMDIHLVTPMDATSGPSGQDGRLDVSQEDKGGPAEFQFTGLKDSFTIIVKELFDSLIKNQQTEMSQTIYGNDVQKKLNYVISEVLKLVLEASQTSDQSGPTSDLVSKDDVLQDEPASKVQKKKLSRCSCFCRFRSTKVCPISVEPEDVQMDKADRLPSSEGSIPSYQEIPPLSKPLSEVDMAERSIIIFHKDSKEDQKTTSAQDVTVRIKRASLPKRCQWFCCPLCCCIPQEEED